MSELSFVGTGISNADSINIFNSLIVSNIIDQNYYPNPKKANSDIDSFISDRFSGKTII